MVFKMLAVLLLSVATASAQPRGRAEGAGDRAAVSPAEIQRMLDGYMLIQAQELLQLSDEQFPQFVTRMRELQQRRQQAQLLRQRGLQELRRMVNGRGGSADEANIEQRLQFLAREETRAAAEIQERLKAIDDLLTPTQQARFRLFEETMEQRKLELLMRARQARGSRQP
jgi:hypothetical protein